MTLLKCHTICKCIQQAVHDDQNKIDRDKHVKVGSVSVIRQCNTFLSRESAMNVDTYM